MDEKANRQALLIKAKAGDKQAREQFIVANFGLSHKVAHRFKAYNKPHEDVFQAGCVGLIKAFDSFDLSRGLQFSTYAVPMIAGSIMAYIRLDSPVHMPRTLGLKNIQTIRYALLGASGDETNIFDAIADGSTPVDDWIETINVELALSKLDLKERRIIHLYFWRWLTEAQIGGILGISQPHVGRIKTRALRKLQALLY